MNCVSGGYFDGHGSFTTGTALKGHGHDFGPNFSSSIFTVYNAKISMHPKFKCQS